MSEPEMVECPECGGDGEVDAHCYVCGSETIESCDECDGTGEIESTKENV